MLTRNYFSFPAKTEILPKNPVSETRNHTLVLSVPVKHIALSFINQILIKVYIVHKCDKTSILKREKQANIHFNAVMFSLS